MASKCMPHGDFHTKHPRALKGMIIYDRPTALKEDTASITTWSGTFVGFQCQVTLKCKNTAKNLRASLSTLKLKSPYKPIQYL